MKNNRKEQRRGRKITEKGAAKRGKPLVDRKGERDARKGLPLKRKNRGKKTL